MSDARIPVDVLNPGQVFASLGLLEAAHHLCGPAEGGFELEDPTQAWFRVVVPGNPDPVAVVLEFLAEAEVEEVIPVGFMANKKNKQEADEGEDGGEGKGAVEAFGPRSPVFPGPQGEERSLPVILRRGRDEVALNHWADGSNRETFKLYGGQSTGVGVARAMLHGARKKPKKGQHIGDVETRGVRDLWREERAALLTRPFDVLTPMRGSFNFDPRGAWTAIGVGYSPNDLRQLVVSSPLVEILAAWGLENARPDESGSPWVSYAVWLELLPPQLARAAFAGRDGLFRARHFRFIPSHPTKFSRAVTFAQQEHP